MVFPTFFNLSLNLAVSVHDLIIYTLSVNRALHFMIVPPSFSSITKYIMSKVAYYIFSLHMSWRFYNMASEPSLLPSTVEPSSSCV